jgi:hypothetical protein
MFMQETAVYWGGKFKQEAAVYYGETLKKKLINNI